MKTTRRFCLTGPRSDWNMTEKAEPGSCALADCESQGRPT